MWPNPQEIADLFTFTEEILERKLNFLCSIVSAKQHCAESDDMRTSITSNILDHLDSKS